MKLVHIIIGLEVGGAESSLFKILSQSKAELENTTVISLTTKGYFGPKLENLGYHVHALGLHSLKSLPVTFFKLYKLLKTLKPQTVQTWMYHADLFGGLAARLIGCTNVYWGIRCTDVPLGNRTTYWIMKICAVLSSWLPKKIVCVAESAKKSHIEHGYSLDKIAVISNGFDLSSFKPLQDKKNNIKENIIIGTVGRYHKDKGQDILISAAALIIKVYPQAIFCLVGLNCDSSNNELSKQVREAGLDENVLLLGHRNDIPAVLNGFDIFCMPSRTEGFPNGLGEAMASGLPCVATDVGDASVLGGDTIELVESSNVEKLASSLTKLIELSHEERLLHGFRCSNRIKKHFTWGSVIESYQNLYSE